MHKLTKRIDDLLAAPAPYLTDGGLETTLIFHEGRELPCFAAFPLIDSEHGRGILKRYYRTYVDVARKAETGFVLDVPTWRASPDWGTRLGYGSADLDRVNREGAVFAQGLRRIWETDTTPVIVNGVIGPRGDGYVLEDAMRRDEAETFHAPQIRALARGGVELVSAITMTYSAEAIGVARAAIAEGIPVVISFTVETDGRLPSGQALAEAIAETDDATDGAVLYYMINCAHPDHYAREIAGDGAWRYRIGGLRSNASRLSHEELDDADELDAGDPLEFGRLHRELLAELPNIRVLGGCCGTDDRHIHCVAYGAHDHHVHAA